MHATHATRRHGTVVAIVICLTACAHRRIPQPALSQALTLTTSVDRLAVVAGTQFTAAFDLRNIASVPVEFCHVDGGVSAWLKDMNDRVRPLVLYSLVLDATCYQRTILKPGEVKQYTNKGVVWSDLAGPIDLLAAIRLSTPRDVPSNDSHTINLRAAPLRLQVVPSAQQERK